MTIKETSVDPAEEAEKQNGNNQGGNTEGSEQGGENGGTDTSANSNTIDTDSGNE